MAHDITTIPNIQVDLIDPRTGRMDRAWRMFFENLWKLQGSGTTDITVEDLQKSPQFEPPIPFPDDVSPPQSVIQIPEDVLPPTPQLGTIASYNLDGSPTAGGVSYGTGPAIAVTPAGTLGQVLTSAAAATPTWTTPTVGTVTSVSVVSANGLAGTVATATTTPAITLSTSVTGLLKGNGTAVSAATSGTDYAPATSGSAILYGNSGGFSNVAIGSGLTFIAGTLASTDVGGTVTDVAALTLGTTGTDLSSTVANGTTTPVITLQVPTASAANRGALSSTDWTTFNNKQAALSSMYVAQAFTAQTTIVVTHNFGKYPVVNVIDNTGAVVVPLTITHSSLNAFTVTFSAATTGSIIAVIGY